MGRALGVAGGPYRKLGPTGCIGIQLARDRPEGRSTIRDRATASGRSGPAGGPSQGCSPAGLRCPSHGTSIPRGQVGGTTQIRNGGSCRREHYPCPQARRRQGSLFSHIRSPGYGIPQACRGLAEPGGRKNGRAGGKMPSMPAPSAPGCPRAAQKVSMRPWPRLLWAGGQTRWRTDSPSGVSS